MTSLVIKNIKKIGKERSLVLRSLTFDVFELIPDPNVKEIKIENCTFRKGLILKNIKKGVSLQINGCVFEGFYGVTVEKCNLDLLSISNSELIEYCSDEEFLHFRSGVLADALSIKDSNVDTVLVQNTNICIEISNSSFRNKLEYCPSKDSREQKAWATFEDVTFVSAEVKIAGAKLSEIRFRNINQQEESNNKCRVLDIKSDFVLDLKFDNANFEGAHIDIENTIVRNLYSNESILGKVLNFFIGNVQEEVDKKVNVVEIKNCRLGKSYFHGRIIHNTIDFSGSSFSTPPEFYNSEIPHGSIFPGSDFFSISGNDSSIAAFRALRLQMEEQRNRELEGEFFLLEQKSILKKEAEEGRKNWIRILYGLLSDFGNNAIKPVVILFLTMLCFTLFYALSMSPEISFRLPIDYELLSKSLHFSAKQMMLPFWSMRDLTPLIDKGTQTHAIMLLAIVQSFISLTCVALSALAIRWRFKRG